STSASAAPVAAGAASVAEAPTAAPAPPSSPDQEAAVGEAHLVLDRAIARHHLTSEDVHHMRAQINRPDIPAQQRHDSRAQIAVAINSGSLVPDDPHYVFP